MNTNTNNAIVLNQDSTAEEYAKILRGRYVTDITLTDMDDEGYALTATLTLDNGTTLTVEANEGDAAAAQTAGTTSPARSTEAADAPAS